MPAGALSVFVSSTCYDLLDLRAELASFLKAQGFIVRLSDDPGSDFKVDPLDDSIGSCLTNVESSDVVVCILDRRYGGVLRTGEYAGKSATHAEIDHARKIGKPVFFFVREAAWQDYEHLRRDPAIETRWVEPEKEDQRAWWLAFVKEVAALRWHQDWSNWCDLFKNSADLRPLVLKRLIDKFPGQAGTLAMHPDHIVRLFFEIRQSTPGAVYGVFVNAGVGPAINVLTGVQSGGKDLLCLSSGAVPEGKALDVPELDYQDRMRRYPVQYPLDPNHAPSVVFCVYENRYRDRYRIEIPLEWSGKVWDSSPERWFVGIGAGDRFRWVEQ